MGDLSISASSVTRDVQLLGADHGSRNLDSVVQALRCNSASTLLGCFAVRPGSDWFFAFHRVNQYLEPEDVGGRPDVMNQVVRFEVGIEDGTYEVVFEHIWDDENLVSRALLEAMQTNKTVRSLDLIVDYLEEPHLKAIVDSLLENDTLQAFSMRARCAIACPIEDVRAAFKRILERNMCLRDLHIQSVKLVLVPIDAEGELIVYRKGDPFCQLVVDEEGLPYWSVKLGATVTKAIDRNERAWIVAKHLGQLNRCSMEGCQHLGDIEFRRQILVFFLQKDCQAPPRQMLHIAGGLPVWRPVCRDAR